jgi:SAM-dependent methyltransferase
MPREPSPQELTATLLADPPAIHEMGPAESALGVWSTDRSCYEFIASNCERDAQTIETGLGISTVLFALRGANHVCISPAPREVDHLRAYCEKRSISLERVTFRLGFSQDVLPAMTATPVDLVLVDGCHGFPAPIVDWYYACRTLKQGGIVVLDDVVLPSVQLLDEILQHDPRWAAMDRGDNWAAYRRIGNVGASEDWHEQPWLAPGLGLRRTWREGFTAEQPRLAKLVRPLYRGARRLIRRKP